MSDETKQPKWTIVRRKRVEAVFRYEDCPDGEYHMVTSPGAIPGNGGVFMNPDTARDECDRRNLIHEVADLQSGLNQRVSDMCHARTKMTPAEQI